MTDDPWLTTEEVAERLHWSVRTLWQRRYLGHPLPKGTKFGKRILYRLSDVVAFERQREAS